MSEKDSNDGELDKLLAEIGKQPEESDTSKEKKKYQPKENEIYENSEEEDDTNW